MLHAFVGWTIRWCAAALASQLCFTCIHIQRCSPRTHSVPSHLLDHALNLLLAQAALLGSDGDLLLLAGALVLSTHVQDTVGVDLKSHLNLGGAAGGRGDACAGVGEEDSAGKGQEPILSLHNLVACGLFTKRRG